MALARAICAVLIGRERELTRLEDSLLAAARGDGRVALLTGDAGMGKTRLANELSDRARQVGMAVLAGRCSEAELALPYLPFLEAFGNYISAADVDQVRSRLGPAADELANLFPRLGAARGRDVADPTQSKLRLFESVLQLLELASGDAGLLLVLEDLHWADASTRELLDYLTRRLGGVRILVLGTYRRDEMHRRHPLLTLVQGWRRSGTEVITLEPLQPDGVARMVEEIFDGNTLPDTRDFLYARSEGNPFVLEEMLKDAIDQGDIFQTSDGWRRKDLSSFRLPETVADTILRRVDRLEKDEIDVLRTAAVLGSSFEDVTLVAMLGGAEEAVQDALRACIQHQLLEEAGTSGGYRFRHELTREAIVHDLVATERQRLHSRAADVLSTAASARAIDICQHLFEAKRWREAVPLALKAAEEAERTYAHDEAATLYERTLPFVADGVERGRILCRLGTAHWLGGEPATAVGYLDEGVGLLDGAGEVREAARHRLTLGRCYWENRRRDVAIAQYQAARQALEPLGPSEELSLAYMRLAATYGFNLEARESKEMAELGIRTAIEAGAEAARVWNQVFLAGALSELGEPEDAVDLLDRTRDEAMRLGQYYIAMNAALNSTGLRIGLLRGNECEAVFERLREVPGIPEAYMHVRRGGSMLALGKAQIAEKLLRAGSAGAKSAGLIALQTASDHDLALALAELDRLGEAKELAGRHGGELDRQDVEARACVRMRIGIDIGDLDLALPEAVDRADLSLLHRRMRLDLAVESLLAAGRIDEAERAARLTVGDATGSQPYQLRMDGRIALATGHLELAIERLSAAAAIWEKAGYLGEESRTRRALAEAHAAGGDRAAAEKQLRQVLAITRESGAAFEARKATERLASLGFDSEPVPLGATRAEVPVGERLVTIMFADVRGYSRLTRTTPPADIKNRIAAFQRWAMQETERNHGVVDKFAGDAVMATFNASSATVDHVEDALRAAIGLRDRASFVGLPIGVGIATGPAIVGRLADGANMSVLGEATNLAARLQARAAAGEIILSDEAYRRLRRRVEATTEQIRLKGFKGMVTTHRLTRAKAP